MLAGASANSTALYGGEQHIYGYAEYAEANSGGSISLLEGGSLNNALINSGALLEMAGGSAAGISVGSGGIASISGGIAASSFIASGGSMAENSPVRESVWM